MSTAMPLVSSFLNVTSLSWLLGPIFDKELRVSSRRRRSFVMRSGYLLLLTALVAVTWYTQVLRGSAGSVGYRISRMGAVGRNLILAITWFQFLVAQVLAAVMLSNSIGDEIRRGTLDTLMSTPINCVQIVSGKLLSSLLQLILLLAVSCPLLAILRVFGGMQWGYVLSALSITFAATLFIGSLSMFLSTRIRQPYLIILAILILLTVAYGLTTILYVLGTSNSALRSIMLHGNPFAAMTYVTSAAFPGRGLARTSFSLPLHCLIVTCASLPLLGASALRMRRGAIDYSFRDSNRIRLPILKRIFAGQASNRRGPLPQSRPIRPVTGRVILWKELNKPFSASLVSNAIVFVLLLIGFGIVYFLCFHSFTFTPVGLLPYSMYTMALYLIASIRTAAMAATAITKEKEARTLPILLGTSFDDSQIISGKALAVLWRNAAAWTALLLNSACFYILINTFQKTRAMPIYNYGYSIIAAIYTVAFVFFVLGLGLYFSVRLKSSTAAVMATVGCLLGWRFCRHLMLLVFFSLIGPFMGSFQFSWMFHSIIPIVFFIFAGLLLFRRAKYGLRKNLY